MTYRSIALGLSAAIAIAVLSANTRAQPPGSPNNTARLTVKLPATAKLTFGDTPTQLIGSERTFQSPTLEPGKKYTYVLKASWEEGGRTVSQERTVEVEAGKALTVDFTQPVGAPAPGAGVGAPTPGGQARKVTNDPPKARDFLFTYRAIVTGLEPGKTARIWLPVASSSEDQEVRMVSEEAGGLMGTIDKEPKYGNQIYFVEAKANAEGNAVVTLTYRVKRKEVKGESKLSDADRAEAELFLKPDAMVPIGGKPASLLEGKTLPKDQFALGKMLYEFTNEHVKYSKDNPGWGKGDANWVCDSRFGNCTDFHSLFISMARTNNVPAKFEMGFSIPEKKGAGPIAGYHCWAKFKPEGKGWIPVDISEANRHPGMKDYYFGNLTEDRVTFSVGRDLTLVPKQDGPALNFLIYPYVEVDGKPYASDKVKREFAYEDVGSGS